MGLHARKARAHEEKCFAGLAPAGERAGVYLGPLHGIAVVRFYRVRSVGQPQIGGQILAEIGHPSGDAAVEHFAADDPLGKPGAGFLAGEVEHAAFELAEIDQLRLVAVELQAEVPTRRCLGIELAIDREIGIHIGKEADAAFGKRSDARF